ncbi:MAG TPA: VOC family protein [Cyclobacteriaceae bacterium]|nr:VOC family protein [Cyclobacteriaceae bacterium]
MQKIKTYLWFDTNAEEAVNFYLSVFKDGKVNHVQRWGKGQPQEGKVLIIEFTLFGQQYIALNGGPQFKFTEAISLFVTCETQPEVDEYWSKLTADGGEESMCGWLKDKFGLSWQIVPKQMMQMLSDKDKEKSGRAMQAMMKMRKIDVNKIQEAFDGR